MWIPFSDLWNFSKGSGLTVSPQSRAVSPSSIPGRAVSRCGDLTTRMIVKEWKRRSLVQNQSCQTEAEDVEVQSSIYSIGSHVNLKSVPNGEVIEIEAEVMEVQTAAWDLATEVNLNSEGNGEVMEAERIGMPAETQRNKSIQNFVKQRSNAVYPLFNSDH